MRIVYMGTPEFAVPSLERLHAAGHEITLVVTQPDRPAGRKRVLTPPPVKSAALKFGLPVIQPGKLSEPGVKEALVKAAPDAILLVAYGALLPKALLELPPRGCINAHASLLPKYRGAAPIQWAIARGEKVTGVTAMLMNEGLDTGDMLANSEVEIGPEDTGGSLHDKLAPVAADLLVHTLAALEKGGIRPEPQDDSQATYAPVLKKSDGEIDWTMSAREIANRVRAFDPWPGTFTSVLSCQMKIIHAQVKKTQKSAEPGTVLSCDKNGMVVACGEGALGIDSIQPPGKKRMAVCEYLAGHCLDPGTRLG